MLFRNPFAKKVFPLIRIVGAVNGERGIKVAKEFIECSRVFSGNKWHDHVTVTMCNMGQYSEENYSQYLTIDETKELIKKLQRLVCLE